MRNVSSVEGDRAPGKGWKSQGWGSGVGRGYSEGMQSLGGVANMDKCFLGEISDAAEPRKQCSLSVLVRIAGIPLIASKHWLG